MSIFQHRYSACTNELATTCYYLLLNVSCAQILHKLRKTAQTSNTAQLSNTAHTEQHGSNWATNERVGKHMVLRVMAFVFIYRIYESQFSRWKNNEIYVTFQAIQYHLTNLLQATIFQKSDPVIKEDYPRKKVLVLS